MYEPWSIKRHKKKEEFRVINTNNKKQSYLTNNILYYVVSLIKGLKIRFIKRTEYLT